MTIIPTLDILDGNIVRLRQGRFDDVTNYGGSLRDRLLEFQIAGITHVHIVDLSAAKGDDPQLDVIGRAADNLCIKIQLGGGLRTIERVQHALVSVADRAVVGTAAFRDETFLAQLARNGLQSRIVIALDLMNNRIRTHGWAAHAGVSRDRFIQHALAYGFCRFLCTDIARDGMMTGPNMDLYRELRDRFQNICLIASGGVGSMEDVKKLESTGAEAVVIGRAFYEGSITMDQIREWNRC